MPQNVLCKNPLTSSVATAIYKELVAAKGFRKWESSIFSAQQLDPKTVKKLTPALYQAIDNLINLIDADGTKPYNKNFFSDHYDNLKAVMNALSGDTTMKGTATDNYKTVALELSNLMTNLPKSTDFSSPDNDLQNAFNNFNNLATSLSMDAIVAIEYNFRNATDKTVTADATRKEIQFYYFAGTLDSLTPDVPDELQIHDKEKVKEYLDMKDTLESKGKRDSIVFSKESAALANEISRLDKCINDQPPAPKEKLVDTMGKIAKGFQQLADKIVDDKSNQSGKAIKAIQESMMLLEATRGALGNKRGKAKGELTGKYPINFAIESKWKEISKKAAQDIQTGKRNESFEVQ